MKIKNLNVNKKNVAKLLVAIGLVGAIGVGGCESGIHIDKDTHLPDMYFVNTKNIDMTNQEFLSWFKEQYNKSDELQEQWGDIYPELCDFISKYGEYLDQEELMSMLNNVEFTEVDSIANNRLIFACTDVKANKIIFTKSFANKDTKSKKEIKLHEAIHYLFQQGFSYSFGNFLHKGHALDEGIATMLTEEYNLYVGASNYKKNAKYVGLICELIGSDKYMSAIGHHNPDELIEYIAELCSSSEASQLINLIDEGCSTPNSAGTEPDKKAWDIIEKMYISKHGYSIDDSNDLVIKTYGNDLARCNYEIPGARLSTDGEVHKNYFINISDTTITLGVSKDYGVMKLDENNEIVSGYYLEEGYYSDDKSYVIDKNDQIIPEKRVTINSEKTLSKGL